MANIKLTLPGEPFTKQIVTFTAPCDCASVTDGLVINGQTYTVCDAMGECVTGKGGAWCSGAQVSVILDCTEKKAYIQNAANGGGIAVNPNLLHNWYFANCVNQRGQLEYLIKGYAIDGWKQAGTEFNLTVNNGISLAHTNGAFTKLVQCVEHAEQLAGEKVTLSVMASGTATMFAFLFCNGSTSGTGIGGKQLSDTVQLFSSVSLTLPDDLTSLELGIGALTSSATGVINLHAVKLELGNTQTLAHNEGTEANPVWVLNEIPDYNEELLKCCMSTADPADEYANNKMTPAAIGAAASSHNHSTSDISGTLPVANGGTGQTTSPLALYGLVNGSEALTTLETGDYIPIGDVSETTGKKITATNLATYLCGAFGCSKIATGSYTGTGTYGSSNKTSVNCGFVPKLFIVIQNDDDNNYGYWGMWVYGMTNMLVDPGSYHTEYIPCSRSTNKLSWYDASPDAGYEARRQMNVKSKTYHWVALG